MPIPLANKPLCEIRLTDIARVSRYPRDGIMFEFVDSSRRLYGLYEQCANPDIQRTAFIFENAPKAPHYQSSVPLSHTRPSDLRVSDIVRVVRLSFGVLNFVFADGTTRAFDSRDQRGDPNIQRLASEFTRARFTATICGSPTKKLLGGRRR